jgi:hypothetical protein
MVKILPKNFLNIGVDLQKWHINNIGWKKKDALEIINYLIRNNYENGIYGGGGLFLFQ